MTKDNKIYYATEVFLICAFVFNIFTTSISNYTFTNFILKFFALILFFASTYSSLNFHKISFSTIIKQERILRSLKYLLLFSVLTGLTLFYSQNQNYGFDKWSNLTFITLPFVFLTIINYSVYTFDRLKILIIIFGVISLIVSITILTAEPFDYSGIPYRIDLSRWSHVVSGRLLSLFVLTSMLSIIYFEKSFIKSLHFFVFIISGYALYLTGLRAALIGLIILIPCIILFVIITKKYIKSVQPLIISLVFILILITIKPANKYQAERLNNLTKINNLEFGNDGAINARLKGWEIAYDMYLDNPITGVGIGGYNQFYKTELLLQIKYPHNLFVELIVEYGLIGILAAVLILFFLLIIFLRILKSNFNPDFFLLNSEFVILLFFLWLAMFSKEIQSQSIIYISIIISKEVLKNQIIKNQLNN